MNFTREPIIETIITPREGCKLVIRNSKGVIGQEEFFVDALEVVSFGPALFFRSLERPKSFLLPVTDYEVLEVRETRMVLKTTPLEKGIKIGGGRDSLVKKSNEINFEQDIIENELEEDLQAPVEREAPVSAISETRLDKKRDRRRHRRRRGRNDDKESTLEDKENTEQHALENSESPPSLEVKPKPSLPTPLPELPLVSTFAGLLPPPKSLISETIAQYRGKPEYKKVFFQEPEEDSPEASENPQELFEESKLPSKEDLLTVPPQEEDLILPIEEDLYKGVNDENPKLILESDNEDNKLF